MATTIKKSHLEIIIDISNRIIWYKRETLSAKSYAAFETIWVPKLVQQIKDNEFVWNSREKNTALWILDQVCHCKTLTPGIKPKDGIPLADTPLGEKALELLRAMSKGQESYDLYANNNKFQDLFD